LTKSFSFFLERGERGERGRREGADREEEGREEK
jgi:hypothetical protein